jgi:hypothetical protein
MDIIMGVVKAVVLLIIGILVAVGVWSLSCMTLGFIKRRKDKSKIKAECKTGACTAEQVKEAVVQTV